MLKILYINISIFCTQIFEGNMGYYSDIKHAAGTHVKKNFYNPIIMSTSGYACFNMYNNYELYSNTYKKVPIWHLPDSIDCIDFDSDGSKWLEEANKNDEDEISLFKNSPKGKNVNLEPYSMEETFTIFNDQSIQIEGKTRKYKILEKHPSDSEMISITVKDRTNKVVAEKIYNIEQDDGRKLIHLYGENGNDKFEVVRVYPFQPSQNKATDVVNFVYTSEFSKFIRGGIFEHEYYLLNGKEVKAEQISMYEYEVTDENGTKTIYKVK